MATQDNTSNASNTAGLGIEVFTSSFTFAGETAGEVVQMFTVEPGMKVVDVRLYQAALGASATLIVGDGTDPNGYITSTTANTAAVDRLNGAYGAGKTYSAQDTIDITTETAAVTGQVDLTVFVQRTYA